MRLLIIVSFVAVATISTEARRQVTHGDHQSAAPGDPRVILLNFHDLSGAATTFTGREVSFRDIRVDETETRGFWATGTDGQTRVFVLPAEGELVSVSADDLVNIRGDVRPLTPDMATRLELDTHASVFIYAYTVRPAVTLTR